MKNEIIPRDFLNHYTPKVAQDLLGCFLVRKYQGKITKAIITETEAYRGRHDLGSHASRGQTERNRVMYGRPGYAYVYFCYGMHWMLNIVTEKENYPAAVLIRSAKIIQNSCLAGPLRREASRRAKFEIKNSNLDGPGKLTKNLHINKSLNGHDLCKGEKLWLELPERKKSVKIESTPRIGIDYAKHCKGWKWNFKLKK